LCPEHGLVYEAETSSVDKNTRNCEVKFIGYNSEEEVIFNWILEPGGE